MSTMIEKIARALEAEAEKFQSPVSVYVAGEAANRWEEAHPGLVASLDRPDIDWELESWKILARAAVGAQRDTKAQIFMTVLKEALISGCFVSSDGLTVTALLDKICDLAVLSFWFSGEEDGYEFTEEECPGHVASESDKKRCGRCGVHIDSLRPPADE